MSILTDLIASQVQSSAKGSNLSENVLKGLSDSVLGSVKESAQTSSGISDLTSLFTGKTKAESSPVTALATNLFTDKIASKLKLDASTTKTAAALLPTIISAIVSATKKDKSKSGGLDLNSIIASVGGEVAKDSLKNAAASSLKNAAGSLLGKLFK